MNPVLRLCAGVGILCCCAAVAEPLPQPLTLDYALSLASAPHPDVETQLAELDLALARQQQTAAENAIDARVIADGRWVEPSTGDSFDETDDTSSSSHNDSRLQLIISKRLYDFGQSDAHLAAAGALRDVQQRRLEALQGKRRLQIMRSYFDVLLADLAFAEADEAMAIEYVRFDRLRERNALKQVSDVEVAQQEFSYQRMRLERYKADARRRTSRAELAEVLGRPGELPGDLLEPEFAELSETPEPETWMAQALQANPLLLALRAEAEAAREHLRAARYANRPVLSGELSASDYEREFASRDRYRAAVKLDVPLYTGGRVDAQRAAALARLREADAGIERAQSDIRLSLREAAEQIAVLQVQREQAAIELAYRDLHLDEARTLYEMEATADLGNSMADFSGARLHQTQAKYQLALTWAEIALLTGHPEWDPFAAAQP